MDGSLPRWLQTHSEKRNRKHTQNEELIQNNTSKSDLTSGFFHPCSLQPLCCATSLSTLTSAVLQRGVAIVTQFAALAGRAFAVVQAEQTLAAPRVARFRVRHLDVVVALAGLALSARLSGVSIVTRGALVTAGTCEGGKRLNF